MTQIADMTFTDPAVRPRRRLPTWARVFLGGAALWLATVVTTFATGNPNLVPTVILLGSFLVPVTFVVYAFGRADGVLTPQRIFLAFICGGVLGVLGASVLEAALLRQASGPGFLGVGLIEEAVKLAALWLLARRLPRYTVRDGMVLGAAVGFGFAALESAGYAFTALFTTNGLSLLNVVETEALRAALAPVGHGLWTAILGGALFATAARARTRPGARPRLRFSLVGWYLLVSVLHAIWDAASGIAVWLTLVLTGSPAQWNLIRLDQAPGITPGQVHLDTALTWGLMGADAVIGVLFLLLRRRRDPARGGPLAAGPAVDRMPVPAVR
jgi:RsiW-degrading membrane proteinase PrsW (M82 family)